MVVAWSERQNRYCVLGNKAPNKLQWSPTLWKFENRNAVLLENNLRAVRKEKHSHARSIAWVLIGKQEVSFSLSLSLSKATHIHTLSHITLILRGDRIVIRRKHGFYIDGQGGHLAVMQTAFWTSGSSVHTIDCVG